MNLLIKMVWTWAICVLIKELDRKWRGMSDGMADEEMIFGSGGSAGRELQT